MMVRCHQKNKLQVRSAEGAEGVSGKKYIEGYFVVFNTETELWSGYFEQIAPEAFEVEGMDIRCLYNHNSDIILGRQGNATVKLRKDDKGIWASVEINPDDPQAMAAYARVQRGDIYGCSFGFDTDPGSEVVEYVDNDCHVTITRGTIHEISVCVFPAYEQTEIEARSSEMLNRSRKAQVMGLREKLGKIKI